MRKKFLFGFFSFVLLLPLISVYAKKKSYVEQKKKLKQIQKLIEAKKESLRGVKWKQKKVSSLLLSTQKRLEETKVELEKITSHLNHLEEEFLILK